MKKNLIAISFFIVISIIAILYLLSKPNNLSSPKQTPKQETKSACQNCNVILISIDDLRADHLGINGYKRNISPNIDSFFRDAVNFKNTSTAAPWTLPSFASMLTSHYPKKLDVEITTDILPQETKTVAEIFKENNYTTAAFSNGAFVTKGQGFAQGFDEFYESQEWQDAQKVKSDVTAWLSNNHQKKFFLFLRPFHIHDPYIPKEETIKKLDPGYTDNLDKLDISQIVKLNKGEIKLSPKDLERISTLYDAEISEIDQSMGAIFAKLDELNLNQNTIVILTGDHGEEFGERGVWGMHAYSLYEELLHVPLLFKIPAQKNYATAQQVSLIDIVPTILDLVGLKKPDGFDGLSLVKLIKDNQDISLSDRSIYAETSVKKDFMLSVIAQGEDAMIRGNFLPQKRQAGTPIPEAKMVKQGNFKLIQNFDGTLELYNLENDPKEKNNLSTSLPEVKEKLLQQLNKY